MKTPNTRGYLVNAKSPVRDFIQSNKVQTKLNNPNYSNKIDNLAENFFKDLKQS